MRNRSGKASGVGVRTADKSNHKDDVRDDAVFTDARVSARYYEREQYRCEEKVCLMQQA